jgi:hypothetical protein
MTRYMAETEKKDPVSLMELMVSTFALFCLGSSVANLGWQITFGLSSS